VRSRRFLHAASIAALAAMLFAQAAFALAVCDPFRAQSRAQMILAQSAESAPCHEPTENANLCLAHCQSGEQTLDKHHVKVPEAALHVVRPGGEWQSAPRRAHVAPRAPFPSPGPPPRIRFQSLLI
jgi:hypothetical protein